jgi:hypothetical protein
MVSRLPQNGFICGFFDPVSCPVLAWLAENGVSAETVAQARVRRSGEKQ